MGNFKDHIPDNILQWARQQPVFWIATAPLSKDMHINVSPKGTRQSFIQIEPKRMMYEDMTGSGVETISHIRENGRVTVLFQAFDGPPRICRIYGNASYLEYGTAAYEEVIPPHKRSSGSRAVVVIDITKVGGSCGFGIPLYQYMGDRPTLQNWSSALEKPDALPGKTMHEWWARECAYSLDGLPGLEAALATKSRPFKNTWIRPDMKRKIAGDTSMEVYRKRKSGEAAAAAGASIPGKEDSNSMVKVGRLATLKNPASWLDDRLLVGLMAGLLVSALLNYAGVTLI